jgi:signal transduction histidine kinase
MAERSEPIARMAHDVRSPIAVIVGYASLLELRGDERTRLEASARIQEAARELLVQIDGILDAYAASLDENGAGDPDELVAGRASKP